MNMFWSITGIFCSIIAVVDGIFSFTNKNYYYARVLIISAGITLFVVNAILLARGLL